MNAYNGPCGLMDKAPSSGPQVAGSSPPSSTLKIGKLTPGSHIEVVDDSKLIEDQPEYALLLSWHLNDSIISKIKKASVGFTSGVNCSHMPEHPKTIFYKSYK